MNNTTSVPVSKPLTGMKAVSEAVRLASKMYIDDKHVLDDTPFIEYLFQGILILLEFGVRPDNDDDTAVLVATTLRNSLESQFSGALTLEVLQSNFGDKVATLIQDLTSRRDEEEDTERFLARIAASDWRRQIIQMVVIICEARALGRSIVEFGFGPIKKRLPQTIIERIFLYRKFLEDCQIPTQHYLKMMKFDVEVALDALEKVLPSAGTPACE